MSKTMTREFVAEKAQVHVQPPVEVAPAHIVDRTFQLPKRLHVLTVGAYLAFLAVMAIGMPSQGLIIPMAIFTIFIVGMFGVPFLWTRLAPDHDSKTLSWSAFKRDGIDTWTGRMAAKDAVVQVMILPVLILAWGVTVVLIRAIVG